MCGGRGGDAMPRVKDKTYRRCRSCCVTYLSFARGGEKIEYAESYFFDEYKKQYGKTYLEDFESIKQRGKGRAAHSPDVAADWRLPDSKTSRLHDSATSRLHNFF
ncbi:MAG: hypothetical protein Pg6C_01150 [Treponemataceae bacterium]|nr:MAG: hypothetical protein Pg6C_01150 [Treponemataceae bacterium]